MIRNVFIGRYVQPSPVCFFTVCFLLLTVPVLGQTKYPFETARPHYVGARALAMGNAFTAVADDATAGFWNPAGLIQWQGVKLFGVTKLHDRSYYRFDPKGVGYSWRGYSLYWGNKIALDVPSGIPDYNYYSFARQLGAYLAAGLSLKFKRRHPSDYYQFFGYHTSYDIGLLFKPRPELKFGCLLQNLEGRGIQWVTLGSAYRYDSYQFSADIALSTEGAETLRSLPKVRNRSITLGSNGHRHRFFLCESAVRTVFTRVALACGLLMCILIMPVFMRNV